MQNDIRQPEARTALSSDRVDERPSVAYVPIYTYLGSCLIKYYLDLALSHVADSAVNLYMLLGIVQRYCSVDIYETLQSASV